MKIGIDMGHTLSGSDYGAVGILKESECTREIGKELKPMLIALGHTVIDCTVDSATSVNDSLTKRVNMANNTDLDLFISIHLNSGGGFGVETYIIATGGKAQQYATKIQNKLVEIGYEDRGIKLANFYVIKNTTAPAVLVECGFVDSQSDCDRYNPYNIAKAIAEGATGQQVIVKEKKYYVVTDYIPTEDYALEANQFINYYFHDIDRIYIRHNSVGVWMETQYLSKEKCEELKSRLGIYFYSIKEE